jgi:type IV secretory pathway VirB2 component (pilin)
MTYLSHPSRSFTSRPPAEMVRGARGMPLGEVARTVAVAAVVAVLLGSRALLDWTAALPVSPASDALLSAAETWHDLMDGLGLSRFGDTIRKF